MKRTAHSPVTEEDVLVCRCQEVTRGEIRGAVCQGARTLRDVKLRTQAMMGLCQGRTCRPQVAREIAEVAGVDPACLLPRSARPPIRPVPLGALRAEDDGS